MVKNVAAKTWVMYTTYVMNGCFSGLLIMELQESLEDTLVSLASIFRTGPSLDLLKNVTIFAL